MGYLEDALTLRYNKWGEREPLIMPAGETLSSSANREASYSNLSIPVRSYLETRAITGCQGLEFVAFSNAKLVRPIYLPNNVILYPCFTETDGKEISDPMVQASIRMSQFGKHIYDGWLPVDPTDSPDAVALRIEELRESLATFALVSGSLFEWEPKYFGDGRGSEIHYLGEDEIGTLEDISEALSRIPSEDKHAVLRSIAWIARAKEVQDSCSEFLFYVLAIESLCNYIENEANDESPLRRVVGPPQTKAERRNERANGIQRVLDAHLAADPVKAVRDAYFAWVVPIKRMLRSHLERVMGQTDERVSLFFDGNPALYEIRHLIAHGDMSNVREQDLLKVSQNVWKIEKFAAQYVWRVLNTCLELFNRSSSIHKSINLNISTGVISRRAMYNGPTEMALFYYGRI
ncbi:MAG: hypothetical protein U0P46_09630 [Holophagaceae bacterium]